MTFRADFDPVAATLELAAEGTDKFPEGIKDEDTRVLLLGGIALVHDVEVLLLIERDIMSGLPRVLSRKHRPVVNDFILMLAFAEDDWAAGALCDEEVRCNGASDGATGYEGSFAQKGASICRVHNR